jgi:hypothetical protein
MAVALFAFAVRPDTRLQERLAMGTYYGSQKPEKEPGGCMEALMISRAIFGILALPLLIMIGAIFGLVVLVALFSIHWLLGLLGLALIAGGIAFYARWERSKFRSLDRP